MKRPPDCRGSHGQIDQTQPHLVGDINVCMCIMIDVM